LPLSRGAHPSSLLLYHFLEPYPKPLGVLEQAGDELPHVGLQTFGSVVLAVGTGVVAVVVVPAARVVEVCVAVRDDGSVLHAVAAHAAPDYPAGELPETAPGLRGYAVVLYGLSRSVYYLPGDARLGHWHGYPLLFRLERRAYLHAVAAPVL
jgi:hypothetical protein